MPFPAEKCTFLRKSAVLGGGGTWQQRADNYRCFSLLNIKNGSQLSQWDVSSSSILKHGTRLTPSPQHGPESARDSQVFLRARDHQHCREKAWSLSLSLSIPLFLCLRLSACLCLPLSVCLPLSLSVCLSACLCLSVSVCLSVRLSVRPTVRPSVCVSLSVSLSVCLSVCLCLSVRPSVSRNYLFSAQKPLIKMFKIWNLGEALKDPSFKGASFKTQVDRLPTASRICKWPALWHLHLQMGFATTEPSVAMDWLSTAEGVASDHCTVCAVSPFR